PNIPEALKGIRRIARDGKRAGDVISRVRALLQNREPIRTLMDINQVVRSTVSLVRADLHANKIVLRLNLTSGLPRLFADPILLVQVIMNLTRNAVEALKAVKERPRTLSVSTALQEPGVVRFEIRDSGNGISPELAKRLFEPFFTTKPKGMGLGLVISRSI